MSQVTYSVIVPNLHSPRIGEVLDALRRQKGVDERYEILVVGRDRYGLVSRHEVEDPRIRFLESERDLNPAEARNRGVQAAGGRLVFFIDADCIAAPDWMATLLQTNRQGNSIVGGPIWFDKDPFWTLCDNVAHFHDLLPDIGRGPNRHFMVATANMLIEKTILEKVGFFDEGYPLGQDFELSMKIRGAGYDLFFEPKALIYHRPVRDSVGKVLRHSAAWARHSIRVRTKYSKELKTPLFLYLPMTLRLISPGIAAAVTAKIFWKHPSVRRYWYTAPVVFLTKMVWCWTVAREVERNGYQQEVMLQRK